MLNTCSCSDSDFPQTFSEGVWLQCHFTGQFDFIRANGAHLNGMYHLMCFTEHGESDLFSPTEENPLKVCSFTKGIQVNLFLLNLLIQSLVGSGLVHNYLLIWTKNMHALQKLWQSSLWSINAQQNSTMTVCIKVNQKTCRPYSKSSEAKLKKRSYLYSNKGN